MCDDTGSSALTRHGKYRKRRAESRRLHLKTMSSDLQLPIPSPCIGICRLDRDGYCEGCLRSGDEIARWVAMGVQERRRIMDALPDRQARRERA